MEDNFSSDRGVGWGETGGGAQVAMQSHPRRGAGLGAPDLGGAAGRAAWPNASLGRGKHSPGTDGMCQSWAGVYNVQVENSGISNQICRWWLQGKDLELEYKFEMKNVN